MQPGRVPKAQRGGGRNSESSVPPPTEPGVLRPAIIKSESSRGRCWEGGRWKDYFKKSLENLFEEKMDLLPPPAGPEIPPPAVTGRTGKADARNPWALSPSSPAAPSRASKETGKEMKFKSTTRSRRRRQ